ncbi:MAG: hypothetical protein ACR652_16815 [Methylocystis sp.]|uniref:hypothetical protein n=1 Tax=Methylocystis sp. TaxID=1911079 RepID=UPI003DA41384
MTEAARRLWEDADHTDISPNRFTDHFARRTPAQARLDMMLISGGDERIWLDPVTRRDRYGAPASPAPEELWFSHGAVAAISPRGYAAATRAFYAHARMGADPAALFDDIRTRIARLIGLPGIEVALTPSGADAEYAALAIATTLLGPSIVNIVIAPDEISEGAATAASGAHFGDTAAFAPHVERGAPLAGWPADTALLRRVAIRDARGRPLSSFEIDRAAAREAAAALQTGRAPLLHVLDASKTGRAGLSRKTARDILECTGDRALAVVDACQLRCSFEQIRADLEAGFLVMITGSKFVGGPAFCGALLIPPAIAGRLRGMTLPAGLAAYMARLDWPADLAGAFSSGSFVAANLGLALRWTAALAEMEAYAGTPPSLRDAIHARFAETVRRAVAGNAELDFLDAECWGLGAPATLYPIITRDGDPAQARRLHDLLAAPIGAYDAPDLDRACHLGQPIVIGGRAALSVSLGMPHINAVAERVAQNRDLDAAFLPLQRDLELLFRKWSVLARRIGPAQQPAANANDRVVAPALALRARLGLR